MLHLFVLQSITPLIWAYLVFSLHMPFAPFWPSASIHPSSYSVNGEFGPTLMCLLIKIGRDTRCTHMPHMHAHNSLTLMC